jgi:hypothetical protein
MNRADQILSDLKELYRQLEADEANSKLLERNPHLKTSDPNTHLGVVQYYRGHGHAQSFDKQRIHALIVKHTT